MDLHSLFSETIYGQLLELEKLHQNFPIENPLELVAFSSKTVATFPNGNVQSRKILFEQKDTYRVLKQ